MTNTPTVPDAEKCLEQIKKFLASERHPSFLDDGIETIRTALKNAEEVEGLVTAMENICDKIDQIAEELHPRSALPVIKRLETIGDMAAKVITKHRKGG